MVAGMVMVIGFLFLGWRDRGWPAYNQGDPAWAEKESLIRLDSLGLGFGS
jgi:hypothetical protein